MNNVITDFRQLGLLFLLPCGPNQHNPGNPPLRQICYHTAQSKKDRENQVLHQFAFVFIVLYVREGGIHDHVIAQVKYIPKKGGKKGKGNQNRRQKQGSKKMLSSSHSNSLPPSHSRPMPCPVSSRKQQTSEQTNSDSFEIPESPSTRTLSASHPRCCSHLPSSI